MSSPSVLSSSSTKKQPFKVEDWLTTELAKDAQKYVKKNDVVDPTIRLAESGSKTIKKVSSFLAKALVMPARIVWSVWNATKNLFTSSQFNTERFEEVNRNTNTALRNQLKNTFIWHVWHVALNTVTAVPRVLATAIEWAWRWLWSVLKWVVKPPTHVIWWIIADTSEALVETFQPKKSYYDYKYYDAKASFGDQLRQSSWKWYSWLAKKLWSSILFNNKVLNELNKTELYFSWKKEIFWQQFSQKYPFLKWLDNAVAVPFRVVWSVVHTWAVDMYDVWSKKLVHTSKALTDGIRWARDSLKLPWTAKSWTDKLKNTLTSLPRTIASLALWVVQMPIEWIVKPLLGWFHSLWYWIANIWRSIGRLFSTKDRKSFTRRNTQEKNRWYNSWPRDPFANKNLRLWWIGSASSSAQATATISTDKEDKEDKEEKKKEKKQEEKKAKPEDTQKKKWIVEKATDVLTSKVAKDAVDTVKDTAKKAAVATKDAITDAVKKSVDAVQDKNDTLEEQKEKKKEKKNWLRDVFGSMSPEDKSTIAQSLDDLKQPAVVVNGTEVWIQPLEFLQYDPEVFVDPESVSSNTPQDINTKKKAIKTKTKQIKEWFDAWLKDSITNKTPVVIPLDEGSRLWRIREDKDYDGLYYAMMWDLHSSLEKAAKDHPDIIQLVGFPLASKLEKKTAKKTTASENNKQEDKNAEKDKDKENDTKEKNSNDTMKLYTNDKAIWHMKSIKSLLPPNPKVLYPWSHLDISPAKVFENTVFLDKSKEYMEVLKKQWYKTETEELRWHSRFEMDNKNTYDLIFDHRWPTAKHLVNLVKPWWYILCENVHWNGTEYAKNPDMEFVKNLTKPDKKDPPTAKSGPFSSWDTSYYLFQKKK